jgi:ElaB/YqjD/DUF883 family membrane-anchored ribosome-binding protein
MATNRHGSGNAKEQLQDKVAETRDDVLELGALAKKAARETLHDVKEGAEDLYEKGQEKMGDLGSAMRRRIQNEPVKSLLVAAGIGLVLGFVLRRHRS